MLDAAESLQELRVPPSNRLGILDEPAVELRLESEKNRLGPRLAAEVHPIGKAG